MALSEWVFPSDVHAAVTALAEPGALAVAGGTTIADLLRLGHPEPDTLVDLSRLPLKHIEAGESVIKLGALVSNAQVAVSEAVRFAMPALSSAILSGASGQIRNAATVAGNLMQATRCVYFRNPAWACNRRVPGSGCSAIAAPQASHAVLGVSDHCMAVQPSDMAVAMLALDATVHVATASGTQAISLDDFYLLPGSTPERQHALPEGALITAVEIPCSVAAARSGYLKLRSRASYEFAAASVAAALDIEHGKVKHIAVALGGLGTRPWRRRDAEALLVGTTLDAPAIDMFCDRLLEGAQTVAETAHKPNLARGAIHRLLTNLAMQ